MILIDIGSLLLEVVFGLLGFAFLLRLYMQYVGASFGNPIGQLVMRLTDWLVLPLRRRLPAVGRMDLASLIAAYASCLVHLLLLWGLVSLLRDTDAIYSLSTGQTLVTFLWRALVETLRLGVQLLTVIVIVGAIFSWLRPPSAVYTLTLQLSEPLLAPARRLLPTMAGIDFSPLVVLVVLQIILIVLNHL